MSDDDCIVSLCVSANPSEQDVQTTDFALRRQDTVFSYCRHKDRVRAYLSGRRDSEAGLVTDVDLDTILPA